MANQRPHCFAISLEWGWFRELFECLGLNDEVVQIFYLLIYFVNCSWVDTRWQQYSTVQFSTVQYTFTHKQYIEQYNETEYTERNIHNNKNT